MCSLAVESPPPTARAVTRRAIRSVKATEKTKLERWALLVRIALGGDTVLHRATRFLWGPARRAFGMLRSCLGSRQLQEWVNGWLSPCVSTC